MWADASLSRRVEPREQFMAMLLDFLPEAVSLGAVFPHEPRLCVLLAIFIGAQNLPEGFNAYRKLASAGERPRRSLTMMFGLGLLGPLAGLLGYFALQSARGAVGGLMLVTGGGDPLSRLPGHRAARSNEEALGSAAGRNAGFHRENGCREITGLRPGPILTEPLRAGLALDRGLSPVQRLAKAACLRCVLPPRPGQHHPSPLRVDR